MRYPQETVHHTLNVRPRPSRFPLLWVLLCCAVVATLAAPQCGFGDSLKEVRHSKWMDRIQSQTERAKTQRQTAAQGRLEGHPLMQGIDPESEFAQIWTSPNKENPILSWLGADIPGYTTSLVKIKRRAHLLYLEAEVRGPLHSLVTLEVFVPHPSQQLLAQHNSILEIANLQPPNLQVTSSEQITHQDVAGSFYHYNKLMGKVEECSVVFKTARESVINLRVHNCDHATVMLDIVKRLDFKRFNQKLNS